MVLIQHTDLDLSDLEDEKLIEYLDTDHRHDVFEILYERYAQKIYYKAVSIIKDRNEARDLVHDIFIKIFTKINQYKGQSRLSLWIHSVSTNTCLNYLKQKRKIQFTDFDDQYNELSDVSESDNEEQWLTQIKSDQLSHLLAKLTETERLVMIMKYVDGFSIKEMENILNIGSSAVKMRLMRTREKIYNLYIKEYGRYNDFS